MYTNLEQRDNNLKSEEDERKSDIAAATERKNDLQRQIGELDAYNKNVVDTNIEKSKDDLRGDAYLALNYNFNQQSVSGNAYKKPTFE